MSCWTGTTFFCVSTAKTVLDHCSYRFPVNPLHDLFPNSAAYHDVHHDVHGLKANFSQPFFIMWDLIMGTYMDPRTLHVPPEEVKAHAVGEPSPALEVWRRGIKPRTPTGMRALQEAKEQGGHAGSSSSSDAGGAAGEQQQLAGSQEQEQGVGFGRGSGEPGAGRGQQAERENGRDGVGEPGLRRRPGIPPAAE